MAKTKPTDQSVYEYISLIENETRRNDGIKILEMMSNITQLKPHMWGPSIIGFGSYHYKYESGHEGDAPLTAFSPRKANLVLYVLTNFKNQQLLLEKLGKHKTGKICLYINKLTDVNIEILEKIISESWTKVKAKYGKA